MTNSPEDSNVAPYRFAELVPEKSTLPDGLTVDDLKDVRVSVSVDLGEAHLAVRELLALTTGSVVPLNKLAGEPVEIRVNGALLGRGEVVIVDGAVHVRVNEVEGVAKDAKEPGDNDG